MKHYFGCILVSLLIIFIFPPAFAVNSTASNNLSLQFDDNELLTEADFLNVTPVILSATRMSQSLETAPASVTIVTREMIDASGAQEIGDLLRLVPGFQVGYFNGNSMSLAYHGFTGNYDRRLQVLIDGRSAYMPLLSTVEWLSLPLDISEVEKIEVVRGSNAPVYGANAIQGVINIITRKSFEDESYLLEGRWGTYDLTGLDSDVKNTNWSAVKNRLDDRKYLFRFTKSMGQANFRGALGYQKDIGFENVADSKKLNLVYLTSEYQISNWDAVDMQFGMRIGDMDTFAGGTANDPNRNKTVNSQYQSIVWKRVLNSDEMIKVSLYHNYYDQNDEIRIEDTYNWGLYYGTAERFDLEIERTLLFSQRLRLMIGGGLRLDRIRSKYLLGVDKTIGDKSERFFSNLEWYMSEKMVLNSGIMIEHNQQIGTYISPRLALNYLASNQHIFRASVTKSIRTPSVLENKVDLAVRADDGSVIQSLHISQTNLRPEIQYSAEIGYMFNSVSRNLRFDTKLFVEYLRDGILEAANYSLPDAPWVWGNNTWANIQGLESQLFFKLHRDFFMNLSHSRTSTRANWHKVDNNTQVNSQSDWDVSDTVPKDTFSGLFSYQLSTAFRWSFTYYYVTDVSWLQDGNFVKEHDRLDTNMAWSKKLSGGSIRKLILTFQNMLNDYVEVQNETVFKQRAFLKAQYEW